MKKVKITEKAVKKAKILLMYICALLARPAEMCAAINCAVDTDELDRTVKGLYGHGNDGV